MSVKNENKSGFQNLILVKMLLTNGHFLMVLLLYIHFPSLCAAYSAHAHIKMGFSISAMVGLVFVRPHRFRALVISVIFVLNNADAVNN